LRDGTAIQQIASAGRIVPSHIFSCDVVMARGSKARRGEKEEQPKHSVNSHRDIIPLRDSSRRRFRDRGSGLTFRPLPLIDTYGVGGVKVHCPDVPCVGGVGGVAQGLLAKSKNSVMSACVASRLVNAGTPKRASIRLRIAV
jgi:hypothetical protein